MSLASILFVVVGRRIFTLLNTKLSYSIKVAPNVHLINIFIRQKFVDDILVNLAALYCVLIIGLIAGQMRLVKLEASWFEFFFRVTDLAFGRHWQWYEAAESPSLE